MEKKITCSTCNGSRSICEDFPTAPHMPSSLPVSVACPDCVTRCACGRTNRYAGWSGATCPKCLAETTLNTHLNRALDLLGVTP